MIDSKTLLTKLRKRLIAKAIDSNNCRVLDKLINNDNITDVNVNELAFLACTNMTSMQIIKFLSKHKDFDIKYRFSKKNITLVHTSLVKGHYFALKYFIQNFPDEIGHDFADEILFSMKECNFNIISCLIEFLMHKYDTEKFQEIIDEYKKYYKENEIDDIYPLKLNKLIDEIRNKNS